MKLVRLQGGLGNQIFQYALCKKLEKQGATVMLDPRHLHRYQPPRDLVLNQVFRDAGRYVLPAGSDVDAGFRTRWLGGNILSSRLLAALGGADVLVERGGWSLADLEGPARYYVGYWQSESLVQSVVQDLKGDLLHLSEGEIRSFGVSDVRDDDVALHVRRGDYVTHARAAGHHGVLTMSYYEKALALCAQRSCKRAVVFSDDIEWCRKALADNPIETVFASSPEPASDVAEFKLMLEFRNHVIANSTFSWWGARLAKDKNKGFTIAPRQWFVNSGSSFIPQAWDVL
jgi:hypothetical protein